MFAAIIFRMQIADKFGLSGFTPEELEQLRQHLSDVLPTASLLDVNLEHELLSLLRKGQNLLTTVLNDPGVPANQKSQVANSLSSLLEQLAKQQADIYSSEYLKRMEQVFIRTLKALPRDQAEFALEEYQRQWQKQFKKGT